MIQSSSKPSSAIFISYRRNDCPGHAGRLKDKLVDHFGADQIFMDVDNIGPGEDFVEVIEDALGSCAILIAMIGCDWLTGAEKTSRPFENENDYVRLEIATALRRKVRVIPVLVEGTTMPTLADLPEDIAALTRRNSVELSDLRWGRDVAELISHLEKIVGVSQAKSAGSQAAVPVTESPVDRAANWLGGVSDASPIKDPRSNQKRKWALLAIVGAAVLVVLVFAISRLPIGDVRNNNTPPGASPTVPSGLTAQEALARGQQLISEKKYPEAEAYFREALRLDPFDAFHNNQLGVALFFQKKYADAEGYLRQAVALRAGDAQFNADVGNDLGSQGKYAEAEIFHREAVKLNPYSGGLLNQLGVDLFYLGKYADAEASFRKAIALDPHNAELWNNLGNTSYNQKKYAEAKTQYQEALRLDPTNQTFKANVNKVILTIEAGSP